MRVRCLAHVCLREMRLASFASSLTRRLLSSLYGHSDAIAQAFAASVR